MGDVLGLAVVALVGLAIVAALMTGLRRVGPDEEFVVFRLGRADPGLTRGPGLTMLIPIVDRAERVSLAERRTEVPPADLVAGGGGTVRLGAIIGWRVVNALKSQVNVEDVDQGVAAVAAKRLVESVAARPIDALTRDREAVATAFRDALGPIEERWGIEIDAIEVIEGG